MPNITGIKYVGPFFDMCYDSETEVLTDSGWKFFKDLIYSDKLCTLNSNHVMEYHNPEKLIAHDWDGIMYRLYSYRSCIDLLTTQNHSMYVQNEYWNRVGKNVGWKFETPSEIFGYCRYFKKDGKWIQKGIDFVTLCRSDGKVFRKIKTEDWLEFLGYYLSEGSSTISKAPSKRAPSYIVQIRQIDKDGLHKMAKALQKVTIGKVNIREEGGRAIVNDKELCMYLKNTFGDKYHKYIPRHVLNNASKNQLTVLFDALMLGDGTDNSKKGGIGGSSYRTSSRQLRDDLMELLLKIGFSGSYVKGYSKGDRVKVFNRIHTAREDHWIIRVRFKNNICGKKPYANYKVEECYVPYKGKVYCATVSNHTLYVRRNGFPVWCGNSGYGQASRGYVLALHKLGVPITLSPVSFEQGKTDFGENGKILQSLVDKKIDYNIVIIHLTPEHWSQFREADKFNVGYCVWETDKLHPDWPVYINNNVEACMVSCEWSVEVYKKSGVEVPVFSVPHGIDLSEFENINPYEVRGVKPDAYKFYSIAQFTERKNPMGLLKSYWHAFQNKENVALIFKTYRMGFTDQEKQVVKDTITRLKQMMPMDSYPPIYLILDPLNRDQMLGLHKFGDCLVSLDRGEGFGLTGFEAGAMGNPIMVTGMGGVLEYAKPENSFLIDYSMSPVFGMPQSIWYRGHMLWAEPDLGDAINWLRYIYETQNKAKLKGTRLRQYIGENLTWDKVGNKMLDVIRSL